MLVHGVSVDHDADVLVGVDDDGPVGPVVAAYGSEADVAADGVSGGAGCVDCERDDREGAESADDEGGDHGWFLSERGRLEPPPRGG